MCELIRLLKTKSTIRYLPPKGTDGFERKAVRGKSLSPFPPASTNARVFGYAITPPVTLCLIMNLQKNRLFYCMELSKAIFSSTYLMHVLVNTEDIIFSLILIRPPKADWTPRKNLSLKAFKTAQILYPPCQIGRKYMLGLNSLIEHLRKGAEDLIRKYFFNG
jgi:hypothetical protein